MCSRAGSWAWTISACSTGARPLPTGGHIDQADGTAWMALSTQNMIQIALELAREDPVYMEQALALFENFCWIAAATMHVGPDGMSMWDEEDGFYYDVLRRPDGSAVPLKVRSVVGLMPLAAATVIPASVRTEFPELVERAVAFLDRHPTVTEALYGKGRQIRRIRASAVRPLRPGAVAPDPGPDAG